jgi:hypothetical protein
MTTIRLLLAVLAVTLAAYGAIRWQPRASAPSGIGTADNFRDLRPEAWQLDTVRVEDEHAFFDDAAGRAWSYIEKYYEPATGLVRTVPEYPVATVWDIASALAAHYCAAELGLLPADEYDRRVSRALETLRTMPLFDGAAFNKSYLAHNAVMVDRQGVAVPDGYGWSATDVGRLLVWLRIIATRQPQYAERIGAIVARLDVGEIVQDGELRGAESRAGGRRRSFQEGRIGYEQYAARGFALWGFEAGRALDYATHALPARVLGLPVLEDTRPHGCLTSEPFILQGLELGWDAHAFRLALALLAIQRQRYEATGQITIASEDASTAPPHYFYYYCVLFDGAEFAVTAQGQPVLADAPRTVSTKATFGWYALSPNDYTKRALEAVVAAAGDAEHWPAGVHEGTSTPAGPPNVNTAAVILEAALFARTGRPLLRRPGSLLP